MGHNSKQPRFLSVLVLDIKDKIVPNAKVTFLPDGSRKKMAAKFNEDTGLYVVLDPTNGPGELQLTAAGSADQTRSILIGDGETHEVFIVAKPGQATFFRGKVRVPVTADPDLIGVLLDRRARDGSGDFDSFAQSIGLSEQPVPELAKKSGVRLYRGYARPCRSNIVAGVHFDVVT